MLRASTSTSGARPAFPEPLPIEPAAVPAELYLLRNRRTGRFVKPHQETCTIHQDLLLVCTDLPSAEAAVAFLGRFALIDAEIVPYPQEFATDERRPSLDLAAYRLAVDPATHRGRGHSGPGRSTA